ncbi:MAG: hypothetical protein ACLFVU_03130 [Phycisphaerae bacterium]
MKDNKPLHAHTLQPCHMRHTYSPEELQDIQPAEPFSFTKGCRTMKIPSTGKVLPEQLQTLLFDLESDPQQMTRSATKTSKLA